MGCGASVVGGIEKAADFTCVSLVVHKITGGERLLRKDGCIDDDGWKECFKNVNKNVGFGLLNTAGQVVLSLAKSQERFLKDCIESGIGLAKFLITCAKHSAESTAENPSNILICPMQNWAANVKIDASYMTNLNAIQKEARAFLADVQEIVDTFKATFTKGFDIGQCTTFTKKLMNLFPNTLMSLCRACGVKSLGIEFVVELGAGAGGSFCAGVYAGIAREGSGAPVDMSFYVVGCLAGGVAGGSVAACLKLSFKEPYNQAGFGVDTGIAGAGGVGAGITFSCDLAFIDMKDKKGKTKTVMQLSPCCITIEAAAGVKVEASCALTYGCVLWCSYHFNHMKEPDWATIPIALGMKTSAKDKVVEVKNKDGKKIDLEWGDQYNDKGGTQCMLTILN